MPRVINLSNASECSQNNPYFRVTTHIPERYQYEWIEQILVNELSIFPVTGRTYTLSFEDFPALADVFSLIGVEGYFNLTFTEEMLILDVFAMFRTSNLSLGFVDLLGTADEFSYRKSSNTSTGFLDVLSLNESFVATPARTEERFFSDQLGVEDLFVLSMVGGRNLNFLEAVVASDIFNAMKTSGYRLSFTDVVLTDDLNNLISSIGASLVSFIDALFLVDQFSTAVSRGQTFSYQDTLNIVEAYASYIQRYVGSRCESYVLRVEADGGEVISPYDVCVALSYFSVTNPVLGYNLQYQEPLLLADLFALIGVGRQFRVSFLDVIDLLDGYSQTVTWQNKLILEDEMSVADLFSVSKTVNLLLSFIDQVTLEDSYGVQTTITRNRLSFSEAMTLEDEMSYSRSVSRLLSFLDSVDVSSSEGFSAQETSNLKLAFLDPVSVADIASQSQARRLFTSFMDFIQVIESDGLSVKLATGTNLFFTDQIAPAETNERFIQRYEGSPCQSYVLRVEADGGEVIDPYGVCLALGHFADADDPTQGYFLTFQEALSVLTFESVLTNVKRNFTMAFIDGIEPTDESSVTRSRQFTLSFTEQLDLSASI